MAERQSHSSQRAAELEFLVTLNKIVRCVTDERVVRLGDPFNPLIGEMGFRDAIPAALIGAPHLALLVRHFFKAVEREDGWVVSTRSYQYQAYFEGIEVIAYHWHPNVTQFNQPHAHFKSLVAPLDLGRAHFPTGRTSLEEIVRLLERELGVRPRPNWKRTLLNTERHFKTSRTWS